MESESSGRRYANVSYHTVSPLERVLAQHDQDMSQNPSRACFRLATAAFGAGCSLAVARGLVAAYLTPRGTKAVEVVFQFSAVFKTCLPLYVIDPQCRSQSREGTNERFFCDARCCALCFITFFVLRERKKTPP